MAEIRDQFSAAPANMAEMLHSDYLCPLDLPSQESVVTVRDVQVVLLADRPGMKNANGKTVLFTEEYRKGILCGTKCLRALLTRFQDRESRNWIGKRVTVLILPDKRGQEGIGPCIRFSPTPPPNATLRTETLRLSPLDKAFAAWATIGVNPAMLAQHLKIDVDAITVEALAPLVKTAQRIKAGSTWAAETAPREDTGAVPTDREPTDDELGGRL